MVTELAVIGAAVLIRELRILTKPQTYIDGPWKGYAFLGLMRKNNGIDTITLQQFYVCERSTQPLIKCTPSIRCQGWYSAVMLIHLGR